MTLTQGGARWAVGPRLISILLPLVLAGCGESAAGPEVPIASIIVTPAEVDLAVDDTVRLQAAAYSSRGDIITGLTFAWTSARPDLATVDETGLVTARVAGVAEIAAGSGGRTSSATVRIALPQPVPGTVVLSSLSPQTIQAGWGDFTLSVKGENIPAQSRVTWNGVPLESVQIDPTEIHATVSSSFVATEGTAEVRVESPMPDPRTSNALGFTVFARPALRVELLLSGNGVFVGDRIALRAHARDQFGAIIEGKRITWTSSDTSVARIEAGFIRGLAVGSVDLVAEATPASAGIVFHVVEPPATEIGFQADPTGEESELFRRVLQPPGGVRRVFAPGTFGREMVLSPDGTRFAFVSRDGASNQDIYIANVDGSGVTRLTSEPGIDDQPRWSPDGEAIAFRSHRQGKSDIWVMNADGSGQTNLTYAPVFVPEERNSDPAWAPDSRALVFSRGFGLGQALYKVDRGGVALTPFLQQSGSDLVEPAWSADDLIAFRRVDRSTGAGGIEFVMGTTAEPVFFFWPIHGDARTPLFLGSGWLAVSAPVHPESALPTVALYHLTAGYVVVPVGEQFGRVENPGVLVR